MVPRNFWTRKAANKDPRALNHFLCAASIAPTISLLPYSPNFMLATTLTLWFGWGWAQRSIWKSLDPKVLVLGVFWTDRQNIAGYPSVGEFVPLKVSSLLSLADTITPMLPGSRCDHCPWHILLPLMCGDSYETESGVLRKGVNPSLETYWRSFRGLVDNRGSGLSATSGWIFWALGNQHGLEFCLSPPFLFREWRSPASTAGKEPCTGTDVAFSLLLLLLHRPLHP